MLAFRGVSRRDILPTGGNLAGKVVSRCPEVAVSTFQLSTSKGFAEQKWRQPPASHHLVYAEKVHLSGLDNATQTNCKAYSADSEV